MDIIHQSDAAKDLSITQSNYTLSDEEIIKIYAYCQEHPDFKHPSASKGKKGAEVSGGKFGTRELERVINL